MKASSAVGFFLVLLTVSSIEGADFSWQQCTSVDDVTFQISDFGISPDPLMLDDYATVSLESELTRNATLPLTLSLDIRKVTFFGWKMRIPCLPVIFGLPFGSCEYDVCSSMDYLESIHGCPSEFTSNEIPCRCPFTVRSYNTASDNPVRLYLDGSGAPSILRSFLSGKYHITAKVLDGDRNNVMCVDFSFRITN